MKKQITIFAALLLLFACNPNQDEPDQPDPGLVNLEFEAEFANVTKATASSGSSGVKLNWDDSDEIAIYDGSHKLKKFTIVPGSNTGTKAVFKGQAADAKGEYKACYPFSAANLNNGEFTFSVPAAQTVTDGCADKDAITASAHAAKNGKLTFSPSSGLARFVVPAGITKVTLCTVAPEAIAGLDSRTVTVSLPGTAGSFVAAVRPNTFSGLLIFTSDGKSTYVTRTGSSLKADAAKMLDLGDVKSTEVARIIPDADALRSYLASPSKEAAYLGDDIDLASNYTSAAKFEGSLNGLGHSIKGIADKPLIISNSGTVSDITLQGAATVSPGTWAPFVQENSGTLERLTNKVSISCTASEPLTDPVLLAGIAAINTGSIKACSNQAAISFASTSTVGACAVAGITASCSGPLESCTNRGPVSLSCKRIAALGTVGDIKDAGTSLGGIAAFCHKGFSAKGCENFAAVQHVASDISNPDGLAFRTCFAGIAANPAGLIENCHNHGSVEVRATTADGSEYSAENYIVCMGGISGSDYDAPSQNSTDIAYCTNDGPITAVIDASMSNSTVGGIVGWPGVESTSQTILTSNCVNSGAINVSGAGKIRIGGVHGGSGNLLNCSNSGAVTYSGTNVNSSIGGLCGFHTQNHKLEGCSNTGDVTSSCACCVAGFVGNQGNVATDCMTGCKVKCNVVTPGDRSISGMVVGKFNGTSKAINMGTSSDMIVVDGTLSYSGIIKTVTTANCLELAGGTTNETAIHVFFVTSGTVVPVVSYDAEGYVKYSDGTPAAGVSVSDGFSVVVTDNTGHYKLTANRDAMYIYVSLPSDAVIGKNANGCPDFFKRYSNEVQRYDFSFAKQAVEDEFLLFAMADPQAHYASRGSAQISADTDRFGKETVAAVNSDIASAGLPCYGVTLGDIVYSEGSRNSNPGLVTMRSHFQKINMPVFQTMGNHDYTYFYSSKPLAVDSSTSTLYLRAQRSFEDTFGPVNLSFNRGQVHVVCMRNINYDSNTEAGSYHGGFTNDQYKWLQADLANVPTSNMVIICVHIPFAGITSKENVSNVMTLLGKYTNSTVFSGHTHYKRGYALKSTLYEHIHSAVCGQWWWSNMEGDGCPNGYTIYRINGSTIKDEWFKGTNTHMNTRDYQMRIYRGNIKTGGSNVYFQWPHASNVILINVFNGDSRWKNVKVYENGVYTGLASLMANKKQNITTEKGKTYTINSDCNMDWWAIGYNMGVVGRGIGSSTSYQTNQFHMYKYTLRDASAKVTVEATDPYGNVYTCSEVIEDGTKYPTYVASGNR